MALLEVKNLGIFLCYNTGDSVQCRKAAIIAMGTK
mgnify:CR=1 FL=1